MGEFAVAFFLAWLLSLNPGFPAGALLCGHFLSSRPWWGVPVMILGAGETAAHLIRALRANKVLGYRPVLCLDDQPNKRGYCEGVPVPGSLRDARYYAERYETQYAISAMPHVPRQQLMAHLENWSSIFPNLIIVPDLLGVASLWTEPRDLEGTLGLQIRHNLLNPGNRRIKRVVDVIVSALGLIVFAPVLAILALLIKTASPGAPPFMSRNGKATSGHAFVS